METLPETKVLCMHIRIGIINVDLYNSLKLLKHIVNTNVCQRFERLDSATPTHCDACSGVLWGPVKAGLRCIDCGHVCHDKCADAVPKNCTKYKAVTDNLQTHTLTRSGGDNGSVNSSMR